MPVLKIFFHDACFDGTASAAMFARYYREARAASVEVRTEGMVHCDGDPFAHARFDADEHACVDFRYTDAPALTWWFDHHRTAFQPPSLRAHFEADRGGQKFFEPKAPSCTGYVAEVLASQFGWDAPPHLRELAAWADRIDAANFADADAAMALAEPAQRVALWVSQNRDPAESHRYIELLAAGGLAAADADPVIAARIADLAGDRERVRDRLRGAAHDLGPVVFADLLDGQAASPGFLLYQLFPQARHTVCLSRGPSTLKISVGRNPWTAVDVAFDHDVGALCERHGGGGHHAVGGVTLRLDEVARARHNAQAIVRTLLAPR